MQPFEVVWDEAAVERVRDQVRRYQFPPTPPDSGWTLGCDPAFLRDLCAYWVDGFDAQAAVRDLNRFPQVLHTVEGIDIHAVHVVGEAQGKRPLLMTHGWPGSIYEFWQVAEPLAYPSRFGGRAEDAFDLVIPSLPGYGFSGAPTGLISVRTTARLFDTLMRDGFGYGKYHAQGGDMGGGVTGWLGIDHAASLHAIHLNYAQLQPAAQPETDQEKQWKTRMEAVEKQLGAYAALHMTRPQSLAYAMVDNPVAQAAWLIERFHDWSDQRERSFEAIFTRDQLLTAAMIYIMPAAFVTATWLYTGTANEGARTMPAGRRVEVPTAFAAYNDPRIPTPPRSWLDRGYNIKRWTDQPRGGHFAAMEAPDLFVADLQEWGRSG